MIAFLGVCLAGYIKGHVPTACERDLVNSKCGSQYEEYIKYILNSRAKEKKAKTKGSDLRALLWEGRYGRVAV